jgi:hypothetical protein
MITNRNYEGAKLLVTGKIYPEIDVSQIANTRLSKPTNQPNLVYPSKEIARVNFAELYIKRGLERCITMDQPTIS